MRSKGFVTACFVAGLSVLTSMSAFAGQWKQDSNGRWWQNDDGSYPVSAWQWIDDNDDGISESYYFDDKGYLETNTTIGEYAVNEKGCWTVDGQIQTQNNNSTNMESIKNFESYNPVAQAIGQDMASTYGEIKAKYGEYELGKEHQGNWYYFESDYINNFVYDSKRENPICDTDFGVSDKEQVELWINLTYGEGLPKGKEVFFTNSPVKVFTEDNAIEKMRGHVDFAPNYCFLTDNNGNIPDDSKVLHMRTQVNVLFPELSLKFELEQLKACIESAGGTDIDIQDDSSWSENPWLNNQMQGQRWVKVNFKINGYQCMISNFSISYNQETGLPQPILPTTFIQVYGK